MWTCMSLPLDILAETYKYDVTYDSKSGTNFSRITAHILLTYCHIEMN